MTDTTQNLVSLSDLAHEFGVNKSKLLYYVDKGLLIRTTTIGRMDLFDGAQSRVALKEIVKLKKNGLSLKKIAEQLHSN